MTGDWLPALVLAAACASWAPGSAVAGTRARRLVGPGRAGRTRPPEPVRARRRRWLLAGAAGACVGPLLAGGPAGAAWAALVVAVAVDRKSVV